MGFGIEFGPPGCGTKAEWESSDFHGSGSSMQMMPPGHAMHPSHHSHHMHPPPVHHHPSGGFHGPSMPHGSHSSHFSHSSSFGKPVMHSQMSHSSMSHGPSPIPMGMSSMRHDQSSWDNGFARGHSFESEGMMQNGPFGAKWQKKGI